MMYTTYTSRREAAFFEQMNYNLVNMLRVISGKFKGRKLQTPAEGTRPLTDRVKTVIFDTINPFLENSEVLDLYAGSGSFGIEALSRGARFVTFVEAGPEARAILRSNVVKCKTEERSLILAGKIPLILNELKAKDYDIIFSDPPFDSFEIKDLGYYSRLMSTDSLFILRLPTTQKFDLSGSKEDSGLEIFRQKKIGISTVYYLRRQS